MAGMPGGIVVGGAGGSGGPGPSDIFNVIFDSTLLADAASFDITSIVSTYAHLKAILQVRGAAAATQIGINLRLNNDSGNNYDYVGAYQTTSPATSVIQAEGASSIHTGFGPAASNPAGAAGVVRIEIPNYAGTVFHKQVLAQGMGKASDASNDHYHYAGGGCWANAAAVNRLTIYPNSGNFLAGSRCTLYGIS